MQDLLVYAPGLLALAWLALREIAPRTQNKVDDNLVRVVSEAIELIRQRRNRTKGKD